MNKTIFGYKLGFLAMVAVLICAALIHPVAAMAVPFVGFGMIQDAQLCFSAAQAISGAFGTPIVSTNVLDLVSAGSDIGTGEPLYATVNVDTTVVGGSGGIKIDYVQSANADLSSPDILASVTTAATPAAGTVLWQFVLPQNTKRYVGFQYTPLTSNTTAGKLNACIVKNIQTYPT